MGTSLASLEREEEKLWLKSCSYSSLGAESSLHSLMERAVEAQVLTV